MNRLIKMTPIAQQSLWTRIGSINGMSKSHIPTHFLIEGDRLTGYTVSHVNNDLCGFDLFKSESLSFARQVINEIQVFGDSKYRNRGFFTVGSFSYYNQPIQAN